MEKPHHVEYLGNNLGAFKIRAKYGKGGVRFIFRDGASAVADIESAHHIVLQVYQWGDGCFSGEDSSSQRVETDEAGNTWRTFLRDYSYSPDD